jgi:16S rRNA (uracil1498-N3)-methyltransferase
MSTRFFHPTPITSQRVTLDGAEAHHLLHVGRATVGQTLTLFGGGGCEFAAVVEKLGRSTVDLWVVERIEANRELSFELVVGVALPKGDRQKWLVEKLTELGVTRLVPLDTERGVAQPTAGALERLGRSVIEASKQCGRNRLMQIAEPQAWGAWITSESSGWLGSSDSEPPVIRRLLAHPNGTRFSELDFASPLATHLAIGPEGGFTDAEVAAATAAGWQAVALGPRILRVETAAVALAAAIALRS